MFKSKSSMMVLSLLVAVAIWLYVMGEVDPETRVKISDIPVSFVNTEILADYGMAVAYDEPISISAVVSGKRSDVNEAKKNGLTASVDVAECTHGENTKKIVVNLPDGLNVENMSESTLTILAEDIVYEYKPVKIEFIGVDASSETVMETIPWVMDHSPENISVYGAKSSVAKVDRLLGAIDAAEAEKNEDNQVNVKLIPVNKKGREIMNVELYQSEAEAVVRELTVSAADLKLIAADKNTDINELGLDKEPGERIRIVGSEDIVDDIKTIEGIVSVDEGKIYIDTDLPEDVFIMIGEDDGKIIWN